jgi:hypothetical protein
MRGREPWCLCCSPEVTWGWPGTSGAGPSPSSTRTYLYKLSIPKGGSLLASNGDGPEGDLYKSYAPTVEFPGGRQKFLPTDLTSPWWYDVHAFKRLVFSYVAAGDKPLGEFMRQFRGLSNPGQAKKLRAEMPSRIAHMSDFERMPDGVDRFLDLMQVPAKPRGRSARCVGEAHFRQRFEEWYRVKRFWYKKILGASGDIPFIVEAAIVETQKQEGACSTAPTSPTPSVTRLRVI